MMKGTEARGRAKECLMTRRQLNWLIVTAGLAVSACGAAAGERPIKGGPVDTGAGTLNSARRFLQGRWNLESFEVRAAGKEPVRLTGAGTLVYDESGNLTMNIQADEKSSDMLRALGIDIRDGRISTEGRTAIDLQNRTLTYVVEGQAPLTRGPLSANRPRHWVAEGATLVLTTQDESGQPLSVGRWIKSQ
jgi:hypothetical protein